MNRSGVRDYASAERWLQGARAKHKKSRSLYEYNLQLVRTSPTSISVVHTNWNKASEIVTYYPDGSCVVHGRAPGTFWQSIRRIYCEYVNGLNLCIRKGNLIVSLPVDGVSPSKITRCRSCRGLGTIAKRCDGPMYSCWDTECEKHQAYMEVRHKYWSTPTHTQESKDLYALLQSLVHKHDVCKHGYTSSHALLNDRYDCYRCQKTGRAEYGKKKQGRVWDGTTSFGIDANGNYVEV